MSENFKEILAESGLPLSEGEIRQKFEQLTEEEGFITNTSNVSPFWRLISAVAIKPIMFLIDLLTESILPNLFVKTASRKWLQILAWAVGLDFKPATKAQGVLHFTKSDAQANLTIKQGTIIQTERINDVIYRVIVKEDTAIPAGVLTAPIPVEAEHEGASYNLAGGYYSILPDQIAGIISVTNRADWLIFPGADQESDDELRSRYRVQFASVGKHHIDNVYRSMIAKVVGISVDRIYFKHDAPRGAGTANVYLLLDTGIASQPFIDTVNRYVRDDGNHGHGDDVLCFPMPETQHTITCTVYFHKDLGLTDSRKQDIVQNVEAMIRCAFRENKSFKVTKTFPFSRFSFSRLGEEIHHAHFEIASLVWNKGDIVSELSVPRLQQLTVNKGD